MSTLFADWSHDGPKSSDRTCSDTTPNRFYGAVRSKAGGEHLPGGSAYHHLSPAAVFG